MSRCGGFLLLAWCPGAVETWLILYVLDAPVSFLEAFVIEAVSRAFISAGFFIPGALGVEEGGFVIVGTLLGLTPETALAVSLVKRVRDILVGVPALLSWNTREGHRLLGSWLSKSGQSG